MTLESLERIIQKKFGATRDLCGNLVYASSSGNVVKLCHEVMSELVEKAESINEDNEEIITHLEGLRPSWAQGFTTDSIAAQSSINVKLDYWKLLGVSSHTEGMKELKLLVKKGKEFDKFIKDKE